jgi:DnaJ-class molecular chaperone
MRTCEIVICDKCKGKGFTQEEIMIDYHKGIYDDKNHPCKNCNSQGRLYKITEISYEKLLT